MNAGKAESMSNDGTMHGDERLSFRNLDPRTKLAFLVFISGMVLCVGDVVSAAALFGGIVLIWWASGLPMTLLGRYLGMARGTAAFLVLVQAFLYPGHTRLIGPVTVEGITWGIVVAGRLATLLVVVPLVVETTPLDRLSLGLVRLGLPYRVAFIASTALNVIPAMRLDAETIVHAHMLRGSRAFERGPVSRLKAYPSLALPLVISALRRAQVMGVAMDSRAFGAGRRRTFLRDIRMSPVDWLWLGAMTAATILVWRFRAGAGV